MMHLPSLIIILVFISSRNNWQMINCRASPNSLKQRVQEATHLLHGLLLKALFSSALSSFYPLRLFYGSLRWLIRMALLTGSAIVLIPVGPLGSCTSSSFSKKYLSRSGFLFHRGSLFCYFIKPSITYNSEFQRRHLFCDPRFRLYYDARR